MLPPSMDKPEVEKGKGGPKGEKGAKSQGKGSKGKHKDGKGAFCCNGGILSLQEMENVYITRDTN